MPSPPATFFSVVAHQNNATMRPIAVQRQDENQTVVKSGVKPPEKVVTTGFARLTDGAKVTIGGGDATAAPAPQGAKPGNGERRQRGGNGSRPAAQQ